MGTEGFPLHLVHSGQVLWYFFTVCLPRRIQYCRLSSAKTLSGPGWSRRASMSLMRSLVTAWLGSSTTGWMSVGPDSMRLNRPPTRIRPDFGSNSGASELSLLLGDTGLPAFRHLTSSGKLSAWLDFSRWGSAWWKLGGGGDGSAAAP